MAGVKAECRSIILYNVDRVAHIVNLLINLVHANNSPVVILVFNQLYAVSTAVVLAQQY
ncbi:hypothetical protein SDC9_196898 [bioreactor metagenome]|uniref:Uncharacterized protein n=1 Tax=bioreactor metagenome TaxID=1076179 RepID=A0A645ID64_9ZZZZ